MCYKEKDGVGNVGIKNQTSKIRSKFKWEIKNIINFQNELKIIFSLEKE